jgi:glycosyltransferase involved in cell wall biosynthesis
LPIIEANAIERVVVTSNISSMPEVAGDAACLVDPFDIQSIRNGIITVIENDGYRETLIQNGRKNKARFTAEHIANQYYDLYQQLLLHPKKKDASTYTLAPS